MNVSDSGWDDDKFPIDNLPKDDLAEEEPEVDEEPPEPRPKKERDEERTDAPLMMSEPQVSRITVEGLKAMVRSGKLMPNPVIYYRSNRRGSSVPYILLSDNTGKMYKYQFGPNRGGINGVRKFFEDLGIEPRDSVADEVKNPGEQGQQTITVNKGHDVERHVSDVSPEVEEKANVLRSVLEGTAGLSSQRIDKIIDLYRANPSSFDDVGFMIKVLMEAGLSWLRAINAVEIFTKLANPDKYSEYFAGGMAPPMFPGAATGSGGMPYGPYPFQMPQPKAKDDDDDSKIDKQMYRMMMMMTVAQMAKSMNSSSGMPGMYMPGMAVEMEPLLDEEGKIITDQFGNPQYRMRYVPAGSGKNGEKGNDAMVEIMKAVMEELKSEKESKAHLEGVLLEQTRELVKDQHATLREIYETRIKDLENRVEEYSGFDPIKYVSETMKSLKELGLVGSPAGEDKEIAKMKLELDKWKFEKDQELTRWLHEEKMKEEDRKAAKDQMKEILRATREAVEKVAAPVAQEIGKGMHESLAKGPARKEAAAQPQAGEGKPKVNLEQLPTEELLKVKDEADAYAREIENAKKQVIEVLHQRGIQI
jgi:hypothetical protein